MSERNLDSEDNVARYCAPRKIVEGMPSFEAFLLRDGEDFLSTNWLEYFHVSDRQLQMLGVRHALDGKGFHTNVNGVFAVLNVGYSTGQVRDATLIFRLLGQDVDPSHTGVFGYQVSDTNTAIALSLSVLGVHPVIP